MAEKTLKVALAQVDLLVGDIEGNLAKVQESAAFARDTLAADIIVFPELTLTGYPPEDLLWRPSLQRRSQAALEKLNDLSGIHLVIGHPFAVGKKLFNAASVIFNGESRCLYFKNRLPNYSVFDEKRYFSPGHEPGTFEIEGTTVAITICEDLWQPGPMQKAKEAGAELMLSLNASPFHFKKPKQRLNLLSKRAREGQMPIVYVNNIGGQDELVFDGGSMAIDTQGELQLRLPRYQETIEVVNVTLSKPLTLSTGTIAPELSVEESIYQALVLGTRDYIRNNGFKSVVIGLSGGIDSALTLAVAVDSIGAENVRAVLMPSRYTQDISNEDAIKQAQAMGVSHDSISIEPMFAEFLKTLAPALGELDQGITAQNLQARCRGTLLMAISNATGALVLTTGNKSEMALGYSTLYGDMAGGFSVLKDVPKTLVYQLANYRNSLSSIIPERVINRPPSAELKDDQTDQQSLPPYEHIDEIIYRYVEKNESSQAIIDATDIPVETVAQVIELLERNEYKRRQAPPGVRISTRAFGRDWRYPITSGFQHYKEIRDEKS